MIFFKKSSYRLKKFKHTSKTLAPDENPLKAWPNNIEICVKERLK